MLALICTTIHQRISTNCLNGLVAEPPHLDIPVEVTFPFFHIFLGFLVSRSPPHSSSTTFHIKSGIRIIKEESWSELKYSTSIENKVSALLSQNIDRDF
jgi:hypothetical protein